PAQPASGRPREIAHAAGGEAPGPRAGDFARRVRDGLLTRNHRHDLPGTRERFGETGALRLGPDLRGIGQRAGRRDKKSGGDGETHVVVAVLKVELTRAEEGQGIPAVYVVVHRHARIPLPELVEA